VPPYGLPQQLAILGHRIAARDDLSRPFTVVFLLSAAMLLFAPFVSDRRSMTGGPRARGPTDQRTECFPLGPSTYAVLRGPTDQRPLAPSTCAVHLCWWDKISPQARTQSLTA
jgi:hypothetical protein